MGYSGISSDDFNQHDQQTHKTKRLIKPATSNYVHIPCDCSIYPYQEYQFPMQYVPADGNSFY